MTNAVKYGYARVSTTAQSLEIQEEKLKEVGCSIIRSETLSAKNIKSRPELNILLEFLRSGDELWVTRIDRLSRDIRDLYNIVDKLIEKGINLRATEQPEVNLNTDDGVRFVKHLGIFAEFEYNIRRERQLEGIAKAKAKGKYKGRKPSIPVALVKQLRDDGMGASAIAKQVRCSRGSIYRVLQEE